MDSTMQRDRLMTDADFESISELAYLYTGTVFGVQKKQLIYDRLVRRLRELNLQTVADYLPLIQSEDQPEVSRFIDAITSNLTPFFSEPHHFEFLKDTACQDWFNTNSENKKVRIWSAGCASGEEAYSIAMTLGDNPDLHDWDYQILATELDEKLIEQCQQGVYDIDRLDSLSVEQKDKWFFHDASAPDSVKVKPELQSLIEFNALNLLEDWPMSEGFELIFCRNMLIYFNEETQSRLIQRYAEFLKPGGYLILGRSESLGTNCQGFKLVGKTIYQKI